MAEKTNSYQDYQDAQSQLLNIQAQQQANLQEARLMGQSQMATNNTLNQAAQVAAQTVAMGNTTQPVTLNPTTQAVLQQYGLGQPRVVRNQSRNQSTTPQHITVNNNTSNITNNNVSVPANIGGPLQGRPVQINPDVQMGTFKTWLSNVFAQQNAEAARRDREYEKREAALSRNANKVLKKIGEIGGNIGKALDPRRATSSSVNTIRTLFTVLGIAKLAKNWDVIAEKLDGLFNFFKNKSEEGENAGFFERLSNKLVKLVGGKENETIGAAIKKFFWNDTEDGKNLGVFNLVLRRIKDWFELRSKAVSVVLDNADLKPDTGNPIGNGILKAGDKILRTLGEIIKAFISGDSTGIISQYEENIADKKMDEESSKYFDEQVSPRTYDVNSAQRNLKTNRTGTLTAETEIVYDEQTGRPVSSKKIQVDRSDVNFGGHSYNIAHLDVGDGTHGDYYSNRFLNENGELIADDPEASISLSQHLSVLLRLAENGKKPLINANSGSTKRFDVSNTMEIITGLKRLLKLAKKSGRIPVCYEFIFDFGNIQGKKGDKVEINGNPVIVCPYKLTIVPKESVGLVNDFDSEHGYISSSYKEGGVMHYEEKLVRAKDGWDTGTMKEDIFWFPEITEKNLLDIINSFTNRKDGEKFFDLDDVESHRALFNTINSKVVKKNSKFEEEEADHQQHFANFEEVENLRKEQENRRKFEWENSRPNSGKNYILNDTGVGRTAVSVYGKTRSFIDRASEALQSFLGNKKNKIEFYKSIEPLKPILQEMLGENYKEEFYDVLRALLADETDFGSIDNDFKNNNNLTGIVADLKLNDEGTKTIPENNEEETFSKLTKYIFNDGDIDNHKRFIGRVNNYPTSNPKENAYGQWEWKVNEEYKKYNDIADFLKDYINILNEKYDIFNAESEGYGSNMVEKISSRLKYKNEENPYFSGNVNDFVKNINKKIIEAKELEEPAGEGDGDYNLPTYNPYQLNNEGGETSVGPYYSGNSGDNTKTYNNIVPNNGYNEFNVDEAINNLRENTNWKIDADGNRLERRSDPTKGYHMCARHVMVALRKGGVKISGINHAAQFLDDQSFWPDPTHRYITDKVIAGKKDGVPLIVEDGFEEIQPGNFQAGDVSVEEAVNPYGSGKSNTMGHMAMYDGTQWISDFKQRSPVVHSTAPGRIHYFRYTGNKVHGGVVSSGSYSSDLGQYKKEFEDDLLSRFTTALNDFTTRSRESTVENQNIGQGDSNSEDYKEILSMLAQILNSQNSIAFNTAATADEVRVNTEVTAQQLNRPVEKRTPTNSMMSSRSSGNYGG